MHDTAFMNAKHNNTASSKSESPLQFIYETRERT